jgi:creatinine amidohydrolase
MNYPIKLEECSWKQVEAAFQDGFDTVIIPSGSVEQHGPHLPIITDAAIGEVLAERIASGLGHAFAAPVIRPGLSAHHMFFPGSFTLSPETFICVLEDYCLSLAHHGFKNLVLISSHGGNFSTIQQSAGRIQETLKEKGLPAVVIPYVDMEEYVTWQQDILIQEYGGRKEEASGHADVVETAMMLVIRPDLVNMAKAESGWMGDLFTVEDQLFRDGLHSLTSNGVLGDPRRATAEMGKRLLDVLVLKMTDAIRSRIQSLKS